MILLKSKANQPCSYCKHTKKWHTEHTEYAELHGYLSKKNFKDIFLK
jgi:hypothetical protein